MSGPTGRVLELLSLLQTHRSWAGGELAARLGVSDRTLRRDVERLRDLGYEIEATTGTQGGYRLAAGSHLPPLLLDDDEAVAIAVGLITAASAAIDGIEDTSVRAMAKLRQVLPNRLERRVRAITDNVALRRGPSRLPPADPSHLALLAQACRDHEDVRYGYRRRDGEESERLVQPHHLVASGRVWYLIGWDVRRDDWRTFRVDRMADVRLGGVRFRPRELPGGDPAAFVDRSIAAMPLAHRVVLDVVGPVADARAATSWIDPEADEVAPDRLRVSVRGDAVEWVCTTIAMLAASFEVEVVGDLDPDVASCLSTLVGRVGPLVGPAGSDVTPRRRAPAGRGHRRPTR